MNFNTEENKRFLITHPTLTTLCGDANMLNALASLVVESFNSFGVLSVDSIDRVSVPTTRGSGGNRTQYRWTGFKKDYLSSRLRATDTICLLMLSEDGLKQLFLTAIRLFSVYVRENGLGTVSGNNGGTRSAFDSTGLISFIDLSDSKSKVVYDTKTNTITNIDHESLQILSAPVRLELTAGLIQFDPYEPTPLKDINYFGRECIRVNKYKKPDWQFDKQLTEEEASKYSKLLPLVDRFLVHLVPDAQCREFVKDWIHFALIKRCETYLVLNGAKGVGKNILGEHLLKHILGNKNHRMAQVTALETGFTKLLEDCRMIVMDEFKIDTPEKVNRLKRYVNEEQMIEKKGVDVEDTIKTYNSFVISNNDASDMKISWDDRRFSVIDLTKVKLEEVFSNVEIELLVNMSEEDKRTLGYYFMYREPIVMTTPFSVWKGKHFYYLCYSSLPEWAKCLVDMIVSRTNDEITYNELKKEFKKRTDQNARFPHVTKVEDFLASYKHEGETYLGTVKREEGTNYTILVNKEFSTVDSFENIL